MSLRVINIVDNLTAVNFGIWNAAISTARELQDSNISTELWFPSNKENILPAEITCVELQQLNYTGFLQILKSRELNPIDTIICTHGCWQFPTRWGSWLKKAGFRWVYTPHGMLEPWAMTQKKVKKFLYFKLIEKRLASEADVIRAVGSPEAFNLKKMFGPIVKLLPNGVNTNLDFGNTVVKVGRHYLFLSRLHSKKGITPLVEGWLNSKLNNLPGIYLTIAGPDQGELEKIQPLIASSSNIVYIGPVYEEKKIEVLKASTYFLLPSFSEGFPTSVLEAMNYGLIPIISEGCNLPEAFEAGVAIKISTESNEITEVLNKTLDLSQENLSEKSVDARTFVGSNYSISGIAMQQMTLFRTLLNTSST